MIWRTKEFDSKLGEAVESFDRDRVTDLCRELVDHLRGRDDPYPLKNSKRVLTQLRGKRYFDLMQKVADTLIQNEQNAPNICRQYAQSQLDQGNLTAAVGTLKALEKDTLTTGEHPDPKENAEARGLLGRAYKDLYMHADNPGLSRNRKFLENAITYYRDVYVADPSKVWQGINSVALIRRAHSDGVELETIAGPKLLADSMATEILDKISSKHLDKEADTWDFATAMEACVGLAKHDDAVKWLKRYLKSDFTNAFELGSTYRQLTEVWQLHPGAPPGDKILPALKGALLEQQGSEIEISVEDASEENLAKLREDQGYERILGHDGFQSVKWFQKCMHRASAVAQIEDSLGEAVGTGFVVRGGDLHPGLGDELLVLTNAHVVSSDKDVSQALRPEKAVVRFELGKNGAGREFKVTELWTSPPDRLDATLVRTTPAIENVDPVPMTEALPLADGKQRAYIIGHPQGRKLSFSIHDNYLLDYDERLLHYRSPTEPGSSGSPVFNSEWDLIGLHHRGSRKMPRLKGMEGTYSANEGIWIRAIIAATTSADLA